MREAAGDILTVIVATDAAEASAWVNAFAVKHAGQEPYQRFAFWTPDPTARRSEIAELAPAATRVDQRFSFHRLKDLAEDMTRAPGAGQMVVDPFNPHLGWKVGERTENEHLGEAFDRLRVYAVPHQVRCWLVAPPIAKFDLRPTEGVRGLLEEQAKTGTIGVGRRSAQEALDEASVEPIPSPPIWTHRADEVLVIHQGEAYSWGLRVRGQRRRRNAEWIPGHHLLNSDFRNVKRRLWAALSFLKLR